MHANDWPGADLAEVGPAKGTKTKTRTRTRTWTLSRARWAIWLGFLAFFTLGTWFIAWPRSPSERLDRPVVLTTLATITGPFVGSIARHNQSCCFEVSLNLAFLTGPVLAVGLLAQVVPLPFRRGAAGLRLTLWTLGWLVWLAAGVVSFGHALS